MEPWKKEMKPMDGFTPFSSNVVTYKERALLPFGTYSISQNTRDYRPGLKKRPGLERLDTYGYLGTVLDIRPGYDETPEIMAFAAESDEYSDFEDARNNVDDNLEDQAEGNANSLAPGIATDDYDEDWTIGRVTVAFNFHRLPHVETVTAASLFILLSDEVELADIASDFGITVVKSDDDPYFCSTDSLDVSWAADVGTTALADRKSITPAEYDEDYVVEIPLNAAGIAAVQAAMVANGGEGKITLTMMEYDVDFSNDHLGLGSALDDDNHRLEQRLDRYFPFLRITVGETIPVISLFQYNQMRSGDQETIAYYANGDYLSSFDEPPEPREDVRLTSPEYPSGGDNGGGYYPYSDGLPSSYQGDPDLMDIAPEYDSKWGRFINRYGDLSQLDDWDNCEEDAPTLSVPPSWGVLDDVLIVSDGRDYAQFYGGQNGQPAKASLVVIDPSGDDTGTFVDDWDKDGVLVDIPAAFLATSEFYIYTPIVTNEFIIDITSLNSGGGVIDPYYWNGASWVQVTSVYYQDTTAVGGVTLKQDGSISSQRFLLNVPQRKHGLTGYWYKFETGSATTDATFRVKVKYNFQTLENVWDGVLVDAIESKFFDASVGASGAYYTYANTAIDVSLMTSSDYVYFSTFDKPVQVYIDIGSTPNTGSPVPTLSFEYWDGASWNTWTVIEDNTNGLTRSGFVRLSQLNVANSEKQPFQGSLFALHWFRMSTDQTLGDDMRLSITYEPVLDIADFGSVTECCAVWKERAVYSFDKYPSWIYITRNGTFNVLNGDDYAVLQAGDGRRHSVKAMRKFHNELMVWQEEKGMEGGCLTLFEGYSPATFGKLLLSSKIGTLNAQTVVVIDGALEASRTDYAAATIAYFISNYGVFMSDGQTVVSISAAIQNYFDPNSSDCIRNGYQDKCWLAHDPTHQVLRMGLVSGSSATEPNVFPVYDLITKRWSFDAFSSTHTPKCMAETSGEDTSAVQVAVIAGSLDSHIYLASGTALRDGTSTAIDMKVRIELNDNGKLLELREVAVRMKKQSAGNCLFTAYENGVLNTDHSKTIDMTTGEASEENVVERLILGVFQEDMISIEFQNATIDQDMYLYDFWLDADSAMNR